MTEPTPDNEGTAENVCDHFYMWQSPAGTSHSARLCMGCGQPDPAWLDEVHSGKRTDEVRHKVGVCPACRDYLWAESVAMRVEHRCDSRYDDAEERSHA